MLAFLLKADGKLAFPKLSWDFAEKRDQVELSVTSDIEPRTVTAWVAESLTRDFRDAHWTQLPPNSKGRNYTYSCRRPGGGFAAVFVEAAYETQGIRFFLSTNVYIIGEAAD